MNIPILGIGSVSALGCGVDSLSAALAGRASARPDSKVITTALGDFDLPVYEAVAEGLDRFVPKRALRRVDRFTRMAVLASFLAIKDAGLSVEDSQRVGIVFGTGFGPLCACFGFHDTIIDDGDGGASPTIFAQSVHNSLASDVSILLKNQGRCVTLTSFESTTVEVVRTAAVWLEQGVVDYVMIGVGDEYSPILGYASATLNTKSATKMDPLQLDHCSYLPGEGFVCLLLGKDSTPGTYGVIEQVVAERASDRLDPGFIQSHSAVFLSAHGDSRSGPCFEKVDLSGVKVAAYASLYGAMPVALGFDMALAAVSCRTGRIYPSPAKASGDRLDLFTEEVPLERGERIACVDCSPHHKAVVSVVRT